VEGGNNENNTSFQIKVLYGLGCIFMVCAAPGYYPCIDVTKYCEDASGPGEPITFYGTVTNCGNVTLLDVTVVDDHAGEVLFITSLAAGEYADFAGSYMPETSPSTNTVTAEGTYNSTTVWDEASATCEVPVVDEGCNRSPGYWKNHPEAWPVEEITIGGVTYSKEQAIAIMSMPVQGDKSYTMFKALVAAKLNVLAGSDDSCVSDIISTADIWMATYGPVGSGIVAGGKNSPWRTGEALYRTLDDYNNGSLCVPKCN